MNRSTWFPTFGAHRHSHHFQKLAKTVRALWRCSEDKRIVGLASESAFWLLLALVPLAAVSGMIAARVAFSDQLAVGLLSSSLPPEARQMVARELSKVASYDGGRLGPVATIVCVWLASSGVHAVFDAFEALAGGAARAWWKKRCLSIGCCLALALVVTAIAILGAPFDRLLHPRAGSSISPLTPLAMTFRLTIGIATDLLLTLGLFHVGLPRSARPPVHFPGVCLAVGLQLVLGACYAAFIGTLGDGSAYLAGLAVFAVTMTAVFIFMLSLLVGLALNLVLAEEARRTSTLATDLEART